MYKEKIEVVSWMISLEWNNMVKTSEEIGYMTGHNLSIAQDSFVFIGQNLPVIQHTFFFA